MNKLQTDKKRFTLRNRNPKTVKAKKEVCPYWITSQPVYTSMHT